MGDLKNMVIYHNQYNRITDNVMNLGMGASLKFNVDLYYNKKDKYADKYVKNNYHKEVIYTYNNNTELKLIRNFNYYFSVEYYSTDTNSAIKAIIGPSNIYYVIYNIKNILKWFIGENSKNQIFAKDKYNNIHIVNMPDPIRINTAYDTYLEFEPAVRQYDGIDKICVRVFINGDNNEFYMFPEQLFGMYNIIRTGNMYIMAQNMLNYVSRPEYGTNLVDMTSADNGYRSKPKQSYLSLINAKPIEEIND